MSTQYSPDAFRDDPHFGRNVHSTRGRGSGCLWAFLGALLLGVVACSGIVVVGFTTLVQPATPSEDALPVLTADRLKRKHAAIAAAYRSAAVGVDEQTLIEIRRLFDAVVSATNDGDDEAFREQIDFERHWRQIKDSGAMPPTAYFLQALSSWQIKQFMTVPGYWDRYEIARVDLDPSGDAGRVYLYCFNGEDIAQVQWWIVNSGGRWKVYDWELLEYGIRDTTEWAIYIGYENDPDLAAYLNMNDDIVSADEFNAQGDYERAASRIERAAERNVLPQLRYDAAVQIAYAWLRQGRYQEVLETCQKVDVPEASPGVIYAQAIAHDNLDEPEQALHFAERFEALLGGGPGVGAMKARLLAELGRDDEAAAAWRDVLRVDRQNIAALQGLGRLLPDDAKSEVIEHLAKFENPLSTAATLAEHFANDEELAGLQTIIDYLVDTAPESPQSYYAQGLAAAADDNYAEAVKFYGRAVEAGDGEEDYVYSLLDAATQTGDIVAAYKLAPDADEAFLYLADTYEEGYGETAITIEAMRALIDAHRIRSPDDHWIAYYDALLLRNDKQYAAAEAILRPALDMAADENLQFWLRDLLVATLFDAGQSLRAYESVPPADETFSDLAQRCRWALRWDDLAALVEAHRSSGADDPWLKFYEVLAGCRGEFNQGLKAALLEVFAAAGDDESLKSSIREFWLSLLSERSADVAGYTAFGAPHAAFDRLAQGLRGYEDWSFLDRLIKIHNVHHSRDPNSTYWRTEYLWERRVYSQLVELLEAQLVEGVFPEKFQEQRSTLQRRLVGAYVALGDVERAEALAQQFDAQTPDAIPMLTAALARGDAAAATDLASTRGISDYQMRSLYENQVLGEILYAESLAPFREKHPPSIPYDAGGPQAVLLLREAPQLSAEHLSELLAGELGRKLVVESVTTPAHRAADCWTARDGEHVWAITASDSRYVDPADVEPGALSEPMLALLREHTAWIAIEKSQLWPPRTPVATLSTPVIASLLIDDNCLACYFPDHAQRLVDSGGGTVGALRMPIANVMMVRRGERAQLYRDPDLPAEIIEQRREVRRELGRRLRTFSPDGSPTLEVQIALQAGEAEELLWLSVENVLWSEYGSHSLRCRLMDSSRLIPRFAAGEPLVVGAYNVVNMRDGE